MPLARTLVAALVGSVLLAACAEQDATAPRVLPPSAPSLLVVGQSTLDLGTLGGPTSAAYFFGDSGQVLGTSSTADNLSRPFLWTGANGMQDIDVLAPVFAQVRAVADIKAGQVVGALTTASGEHAFIWTAGGGMIDLGTLGGGYSWATGVNAAGQVVGVSETSSGYLRAFLWEEGSGMQSLGTLGGILSEAYAINDAGQVVGWSCDTSGEKHAFIWQPGQGMRDLDNALVGTAHGSHANDINASGQVVGFFIDAEYRERAFLWDDEVGMRDLSSVGELDSEAVAINSWGEVVGSRTISDDASVHAVLWMPNEEDVIDIGPVSGLKRVFDIDDAMQVVGSNYAGHAALAQLHYINTSIPGQYLWDGVREFSTKMNPNGSWSSGWTTTLGDKLLLFARTAPLDDGALTAWVDPSIRGKYPPSLARNESGKTVEGIEPGQVALDPGCDAGKAAMLRWTAPSDGTYVVDGRFLEGDGGDMSAYVLENGNASKPLVAVLSTKGSPRYEFTAKLAAGDYLDFAVAAGRAGCDEGATPIEVKIELKDK